MLLSSTRYALTVIADFHRRKVLMEIHGEIYWAIIPLQCVMAIFTSLKHYTTYHNARYVVIAGNGMLSTCYLVVDLIHD